MKKFFCVISVLGFLLWGSIVFAVPVDLSSFSADPGVTITSDTITLTETDLGMIYAYNDSFDVDSNATALTFDYSLTPGQDDFDWLVAVINFTNYEMEIGQSGAGSYSIDMSSYAGQTISLAFGLEYDWVEDWGYDSIGTISNVDLASSAPVPEPATMLLMGTGLVGMFGFSRKKFANKK